MKNKTVTILLLIIAFTSLIGTASAADVEIDPQNKSVYANGNPITILGRKTVEADNSASIVFISDDTAYTNVDGYSIYGGSRDNSYGKSATSESPATTKITIANDGSFYDSLAIYGGNKGEDDNSDPIFLNTEIIIGSLHGYGSSTEITVFGGNEEGNITELTSYILIKNATISNGSIHGASNKGNVEKAQTRVEIAEADDGEIDFCSISIYGGSKKGQIGDANNKDSVTTVVLTEGFIEDTTATGLGALYGGSEDGDVYGKTKVEANGGKVYYLYGGNENGDLYGETELILTGTYVQNSAYGGSRYGDIEGKTIAKMYGGRVESIFAGNFEGDIIGTTTLILDGESAATEDELHINGWIFGGSLEGNITGPSTGNTITVDVRNLAESLGFHARISGGNDFGIIDGNISLTVEDNNAIVQTYGGSRGGAGTIPTKTIGEIVVNYNNNNAPLGKKANITAGNNHAVLEGNATLNIDTRNENDYSKIYKITASGGSELASAQKVIVNMNNGSVDSLYGIAENSGAEKVEIYILNGTVNKLYGGYTGTADDIYVKISGGSVTTLIPGGFNVYANTTKAEINGGTVGTLFSFYNSGNIDRKIKKAELNLDGGTIDKLYAGGGVQRTNYNISVEEVIVNLNESSTVSMIYLGGRTYNDGGQTGKTEVEKAVLNLNGGTISATDDIRKIYGHGTTEKDVVQSAVINLNNADSNGLEYRFFLGATKDADQVIHRFGKWKSYQIADADDVTTESYLNPYKLENAGEPVKPDNPSGGSNKTLNVVSSSEVKDTDSDQSFEGKTPGNVFVILLHMIAVTAFCFVERKEHEDEKDRK